MAFAEKLEVIQLSASNTVESLLDLNDGTHYFMGTKTFKIVAPAVTRIEAQDQRRWGGAQQVGEVHANGMVTWEAMVAGTSEQQAIEKVETLLAQLAANPRRLWLLWQAAGVTQPSLYEARGTGHWEPLFDVGALEGAGLFPIQVEVPVAPLAQGLPVEVLGPPNETWLSGVGVPSGVAVNSEHVYWSTPATGDIGRATSSGTEIDPTWITGVSAHYGLALDDTYLYWANESTGDIGRARLDGTEVNQKWITGAKAPVGVAVSGTYIYWTDVSTNDIGRATINGTEVNQKWITGANGPTSVTVTSEYVYWVNQGTNDIGRATLAGGSVNQSFITELTSPEAITTQGGYLYFSQGPSNTIGRSTVNGTDVELAWLTGAASPRGLAISGEQIYWANNTTETIGRANLTIYDEALPAVFSLSPIPGDAPALAEVSIEAGVEPEETLITGAHNPQGVATDGTYVYFCNSETGYIGRAKLNGSEVNQTWVKCERTPVYVTVDASHVYWRGLGVSSVIGRATIAGGTIEPTWISTPGEGGIAVNSEHIFWVVEGAIGRATIAGGSIEATWRTTSGKAPSGGLAITSEYLYFTVGATWPPTGLYAVSRMKVTGEELENAWASAGQGKTGIAVSGGYLYWSGHNAVSRATTAGGEVQLSWVPLIPAPVGVAVQAGELYWTTGAANTLGRVSASGATNSPPVFALLGWASKPATGLATAPFGILASSEAEASGWAYETVGEARGGKALRSLATHVASAAWNVDPATMTPDAFSGELEVEIWGRVLLSAANESDRFTLSAQPQDGTGYGAARYTDEWGNAGRTVVLPSSGEAWRLTRLGTLHLLVNPLAPRIWKLVVEGIVGANGHWGLDYLLVVPSLQRACSPSSKPNNASYPQFIANTRPTVKTIKSNLSALVAKPAKNGHPDHGLGGHLLQIAPGESHLLCKLSSLVPDNPEASAATEQVTYEGKLIVTVTPRWFLARTS
jgi:hypothetical protein